MGLSRPTPIVVGLPKLPLSGIVIALDPVTTAATPRTHPEIAKPVWIGTGWKPCNKVGTHTTAATSEHAFTFDVAPAGRSTASSRWRDGVPDATTDTGRRGRASTSAAVREEGRGESSRVSIHADGRVSSGTGFFVMKPGNVVGLDDDIYTSVGRARGRDARGPQAGGAFDRELLRDRRAEDAHRPRHAQLLRRARSSRSRWAT
jgi:hypothetical protein